VKPHQLEGYDLIWRIATESTSKLVIDAAAKLLIQIHHDVEGSLESQIPEFEELFIEKCFSIIKD